METFKHLRSLHGFGLFVLLATISKGSACEAPSSPQCFRRNEEESVYTCEWGFDRRSDVTFDLYFQCTDQRCSDIYNSKEKFMNLEENRTEIIEERLTVKYNIDVWVEARAGNSSCTSPSWSGVLEHAVKYDAPQNILVSWSEKNLSLSWSAAEKHPALAEVRFQQFGGLIESCEKRLLNTSGDPSTYKVMVVNLLKHSAYRVQIRQRSTKAKNPLWSNWSPVIVVPAELDQPEVTIKTKLFNGTRQVTLSWKATPHAATVRGVSHTVNDTHWSHKCPCKKKSHKSSTDGYTVNVSYSPVNITVVARNSAGESPQAIIQVPSASAADLKMCDKTLLGEKLKTGTCLEFYELQDIDIKPESLVTIRSRKQRKEKESIENMKDFTRYLYFEHRCVHGKPQTVKMCLYYKKEGVPNKEPKDFIVVPEIDNSASLSWKGISHEHQRGLLTHYTLCSVKINPQDGEKSAKECFNVSASATRHSLKDLAPETKYSFSLAGVTRAGEGLSATQTITTFPEKPLNVWLSFGLLFAFFLFTISCTVVLKEIKSKIYPPVPVPVIPDFTPRQLESEQEMWERKEEVHELTLHQIVPEQKSISEETPFSKEWDDRTDGHLEAEASDSAGSDDECLSLDSADPTLRKTQTGELDRVEKELAELIYKNGLVFDRNSESLNQSEC